ncbi:MAG: FtsX-like permease family protein [Acidobacteria bacterium]|nr:MAG: FtsX-like permease family protein [Acidobacteriota bacterium]
MIRDALLLALRAIRRNALRSSLTILGIVIGVAAVIVMVTLGSGATAEVTQNIASLGSNVLMVMPGQQMGPGQATAAPFRQADVAAIRREVTSVSAVAPVAARSVTAIYGNENWSTSVTGTENDLFIIRNWSLAAGRTFTESEQRSGKAVCVIGATVEDKLFGSREPLGRTIRLNNLACQVIGVLEAKGQSAMGTDQDDIVVVPLRTLQRRITGNEDIALIQATVREGTSTQMAQGDITIVLRERRHIAAGEEDDFRVNDMSQISSMLTGTTQLLTALLSAVAAVSLLVGGIGIMNIMLVSVTERTREIGIRLAIGAMAREVLLQFLVEAVALSSLGGAIGIVLALATSYVLANAMQVPFVLNLSVVAMAFLFSAAVGMIFGYFPARKAAHLDPIQALRHE